MAPRRCRRVGWELQQRLPPKRCVALLLFWCSEPLHANIKQPTPLISYVPHARPYILWDIFFFKGAYVKPLGDCVVGRKFATGVPESTGISTGSLLDMSLVPHLLTWRWKGKV